VNFAENSVEQLVDQGVALGKQDRLAEAEALFRQATALDPNHPRAHTNLAVALQAMGRFDEALPIIRRSIALRGDDANAHHTLAKILVKTNRATEAIEALRRSLQLNPDDTEAHGTLAKTLLLAGDFKRGWAEYEWRWKAPSFKEPKRLFNKPQWTGGKLTDKTILLHHEQGFGDTIQFLRYVPLVARERGGDVIVQVPRELVDLVRRMPTAPDVVALGDPLPPFDLHIPVMSLPLAFNTTLKTIPANVPYLSASPKVAHVWADRIKSDGGDEGTLRVGLAWAGRPTHRDDKQRSLRLEQLAPLASPAPDVVFYSLQKWDPQREAARQPAGMKLIDAAEKLFDFSDSAAVIANLDLVIAVDTAIAHLAGAMGKPVWTMLPFAPDFRWMLDRPDSPWYPTMRLYRQPACDDWNSVLRQIAEDLSAHAASKRSRKAL
jgi:hypothetical protein